MDTAAGLGGATARVSAAGDGRPVRPHAGIMLQPWHACPHACMQVALPIPEPQVPFEEGDTYKIQLSFNGQ